MNDEIHISLIFHLASYLTFVITVVWNERYWLHSRANRIEPNVAIGLLPMQYCYECHWIMCCALLDNAS